MKKTRILYVEDDVEFAGLIKKYLESSGFNVEVVGESIKATSMIKTQNYDLVLCDLNMDRLNGNQITEIIKKYNPTIKVVIFTCSKDQTDELVTLRTGADEYIRKETSLEVLVERLKKLINETKFVSPINKLFSRQENIELDIKDRIVKKDNNIVELTKIEFDLLKCFLENENALLPRKDIYEYVWGAHVNDFDTDLRNIDSHIKNLRKKMGISTIVSIRGIGYKWHE